MSIHQHMAEKIELAKTYAEDGAFHTAARILQGLAVDVKAHADACDGPLAPVPPPVPPTYYMPDEKRAFNRGVRHARAGRPSKPTGAQAAAYRRGYAEAKANERT